MRQKTTPTTLNGSLSFLFKIEQKRNLKLTLLKSVKMLQKNNSKHHRFLVKSSIVNLAPILKSNYSSSSNNFDSRISFVRLRKKLPATIKYIKNKLCAKSGSSCIILLRDYFLYLVKDFSIFKVELAKQAEILKVKKFFRFKWFS